MYERSAARPSSGRVPAEREPGLADPVRVRRGWSTRTANGDLGEATSSVDVAGDVAVADPIAVDRALERGQRDAPRGGRPIGARGEFGGTVLRDLGQLRARDHLVHEAPLDGARALDPLLDGAEEIGAISAHAT